MYQFQNIRGLLGTLHSCVAQFRSLLSKEDLLLILNTPFQYSYASTTMSVGGLRQQFSLPENVEMSLFGADFLRNANRILYSHESYTPDVNFQPHGYLFLASDEGVETMRENHYVQM